MADEKPTVVVLTIDADGTTERRAVPRDDLAAWQGLLDGGYFEPIYGPKWIGLVDEHGQDKQLPLNMVASVLMRRIGRAYDIVGRLVVAGPADADGNFTDAPEDEMAFIEDMALRHRPT